jgi:hypothetical protein
MQVGRYGRRAKDSVAVTDGATCCGIGTVFFLLHDMILRHTRVSADCCSRLPKAYSSFMVVDGSGNSHM